MSAKRAVIVWLLVLLLPVTAASAMSEETFKGLELRGIGPA